MKKIILSFTILIIGYSVLAQDWMKKYDEVGVFENDRAYVRKNKKYGYVDKNGNEIIPCIYTYVGTFNEQGIVWVNKGNQYGVYNIDGKAILPAEYIIGTFDKKHKPSESNPYANLKTDNLFANNKGLQWVGRNCGRFNIHSPSEHNGKPFDKLQTEDYITFKTNTNKWGVCDLNGDIIFLRDTYDYCYYPSENYMPVAKIINGEYSINYIDLKTKSLVFDNFIKTKAPTPVINGKFIVIDNSGCYFMNLKGEKIGKTYEALFPSDDEDIYTVYKNSKYGIINTNGDIIIEIKYKLLSTADNGLICFVDKGKSGKSEYGYMNLSGEVVSPPQYNAVNHFENKRAIVRKGDKYGCIDTLGREILPCRFYSINIPKSQKTDVYFVKEEKNGPIYAYKAYTTTRLIEQGFKNVRNFDRDYDHVAFVTQRPHGAKFERIGCINENGEIVIPCICNSYDKAFQLYSKRIMEGKHKWTNDDDRYYSIIFSYHDDFTLYDVIQEKYWDF